MTTFITPPEMVDQVARTAFYTHHVRTTGSIERRWLRRLRRLGAIGRALAGVADRWLPLRWRAMIVTKIEVIQLDASRIQLRGEIG